MRAGATGLRALFCTTPKGRVYGVRGGPRPGVYPTWDEAQQHSVGHSGAMCKKFSTAAEAAAFAEGGTRIFIG